MKSPWPWLSRRTPGRLLLLGLLFREAFSFWTGHPWDMEVWIRNAYNVSNGLDPYRYMNPVPGLSFAYLQPPPMTSVGYLPLWPLLLASLFRLWSVLPGSNRFVLYFLLKQPSVLGDVLLGYLIFRAVARWGGSPGAARGTLAFWMLFPYAILVTSIWGMFDSMVASLLVASLLTAYPWRRSGLLGVGILLKFLPLIFIPFAFLRGFLSRPYQPDKWVPWWGALVAVAIPPVFTLLAFVLLGWSTQGIQAMLWSSSHGTPGGMTYVRVLGLPPFLSFIPQLFFLLDGVAWVVAVAVASVLVLKLFPRETPGALVQALMLITAAFFLTRWSVYEQYLLYLLPLLLIDITLWHPERKGLFHVTWILGLVFMGVNNILFIRFLGPAYPAALDLDQFWDTTPPMAYVRYGLLDLLGVLFSLHMLQVVLTLSTPRVGPTPWVLRPFLRLRSGPITPTPGPGGED